MGDCYCLVDFSIVAHHKNECLLSCYAYYHIDKWLQHGHGQSPIVLLVMGISQLCTLLPMIFLKKEHTCMHFVSAETMFLLELEGTALNPLIINSPVL